jgi:hypothetical protein
MCLRNSYTSSARSEPSGEARQSACAFAVHRAVVHEINIRVAPEHTRVPSQFRHLGCSTRKVIHVLNYFRWYMQLEVALSEAIGSNNRSMYSASQPAQNTASPKGPKFQSGYKASAGAPSNTNQFGTALHSSRGPNWAFKRSANGRPPGPGCGVHHSPQPGPGALPLSPA